MTAVEKRAKFVSNLRSLLALASGGRQSFDDLCQPTADLLTFTDDEPAAPAQEPDWRDEVVGWGTGWLRCVGVKFVTRHSEDIRWVVRVDGQVTLDGADGPVVAGPNNDPLSRCRAIDRFLSELGKGAGS